VLTALLLLGWGIGGILCGVVADRWGRARTLLFSIGVYSVATAACALSTSMNMLIIFRFISALGIGGEWASGASLLAESMPQNKRVLAGALMFTAAPIGSMMGFLVNLGFDALLPGTISSNSEYSWRLVFASAILPIFITLLIRFRVKEPESWARKAVKSDALSLGDLFAPDLKRRTSSSIFLVLLCLIAWWCISSFLPTFSSSLAHQVLQHESSGQALEPQALKNLSLFYNGWGSASLYIGGILGAFSVVFFTNGLFWPRLHIFKLFFFITGVSLLCVYYPGLQFSRHFNMFRLVMMLPLGLATQGYFAIHSFYIPEQFPTAIRARGAGLTYNVSRILTAIFPLTVGKLILSGVNTAYILLAFVAIPVIGLIFLFIPNLAFETQHMNLFDEEDDVRVSTPREVDADEFGDHKFVVIGDDEEFNPQSRKWWRGSPPKDSIEI
jgi:MFS family permease